VLPRGPGDPVDPVRLSRPALQAFVFDPPNELVTVFPLIPTFLTPLSILLR